MLKYLTFMVVSLSPNQTLNITTHRGLWSGGFRRTIQIDETKMAAVIPRSPRLLSKRRENARSSARPCVEECGVGQNNEWRRPSPSSHFSLGVGGHVQKRVAQKSAQL
ncbi:hypothetical protein BN2476_560134 [Paraburkholderia piptadeniae]|uniref:Uncharacterized protein n=1 Tax=Paraburkholderia piptadeniae TaxID=1701573 RepID=A0A1N7SIY2_9BURK|nr:hypothetical protein BN2476_560134 [Paraburkholderia piptadeniae]